MQRRIYLLILLCLCASVEVHANFIEYSVAGKVYEGYYLKEHKKAPLVVIIHDWDGLTDYEVKRAKMLSSAGYNVFAVDMFGKGVRPTKIEDKKNLTGALYKDRKKMRMLIKAGLMKANDKGLNTKNAAIMGYCFGGTCVLESARAGDQLNAFVSFHGGLTIPKGQNYKNTKGRLLVFHGTTDKYVTMQDFANLAIELEKDGVNHEMITYSNAPHAFTVFKSERYREQADKKSWRRLLEDLSLLKRK
jgi:dienelactone hydrolase